jgi:hypothetical protein
MARGILDALYWRLHTAYLTNDRAGARRFLAMLADEEALLPGGLGEEVGVPHLLRYDRIRRGVESGGFPRLHGAGYEAPEGLAPAVPADPGVDERAFCSALVKERAALLGLLGASPAAIVASEVEMDPYGRCDLLLRDGRVLHVVEVKMGDAPTAVVSQIDKYRLAMELDMCAGLHDEVRAWVVAGGFPPYVACELSRAEVGMILHAGRASELRLAPGAT